MKFGWTSTISTASSVAASAAVAAVIALRHRGLAGGTEEMIRAALTMIAFLFVPPLVGFSYLNAASLGRTDLPRWRRGLGLLSMVTLSVAWIIYAILQILPFAQTRPDFLSFVSLGWLTTILSWTVLAGLFALALRGAARTQMLAAALLLWAWIEAGIFV